MLGVLVWGAAQLRPVRTDPASWAVREELLTSVNPAALRSIARAPTKARDKRSPQRAQQAAASLEQRALDNLSLEELGSGASLSERATGAALESETPLTVIGAPELIEELPMVSAEQFPAPVVEPAVERPRPQRMPNCQADLRLVGSAVNDARPGLSRAVVRNAAGAFLLGVGGRIDTFTVVSIEATRAALRAPSGELCALSGAAVAPARSAEPAPVAQPVTAAPADPHPEPKGKPVFSKDELAKGVRALGGGTYAVSKQLLLKAMTNPGGAAGGAWFRPFKRDGQSVGMEVRAVRDGTALNAMGIETGDVARTVNGIALDTPQGLLAALRAVRETDTITIGILRDGQARDMRYLTE